MARSSKYSDDLIKTDPRKELKAKRKTGYIIFVVIAALVLVGSVPVNNLIFKHTMESSREVNVLPDFVLKLIPKSIISNALGGSSDNDGNSPDSDTDAQTSEEASSDSTDADGTAADDTSSQDESTSDENSSSQN